MSKKLSRAKPKVQRGTPEYAEWKRNVSAGMRAAKRRRRGRLQ
jgi:hypothetical protein